MHLSRCGGTPYSKPEAGDFSSEDVAQVLQVLHVMLPKFGTLKVLGIASLNLTLPDMHQVVSILSLTRDHLQGVALTVPRWYEHPSTSRLEPVNVLFQAIRKMKRL